MKLILKIVYYNIILQIQYFLILVQLIVFKLKSLKKKYHIMSLNINCPNAKLFGKHSVRTRLE